MCGIFCGINCKIETKHELVHFLRRRGPDYFSFHNINVDNVSLEFGSSVLWHQGMSLCSQPLQEGNFIILFNGDIFNIADKSDDTSDTEWLGKKFSICKDDGEMCDLIQSLEGSFSLIVFNKCSRSLYICRDSMGRNSLIIEKEFGNLCFLSTSRNFGASKKYSMELPPLGLYMFDVAFPTDWKLFPWKQTTDVISDEIKNLNNIFGLTVSIADNLTPNWLRSNLKLKRSFNFYEICANLDSSSNDLFEALLEDQNLVFALQQFSILLEKSVKNRVRHTTPYCMDCIHNGSNCNHAKIAILFSGGIDCSILAALSNKYVNENDPIDLINVAFEKLGASGEVNWDVPDRFSAKASLLELKNLYPQRMWNYVEVNISREELYDNLQTHIKHLIFPLNTILDESIGCAFWFASRGKGICLGKEYISPARVVIVGSGADELFGGYMRHRKAFCRYEGNETQKLANLRKELEHDWGRIWKRNLGRDDRVVADNGKTLRAPFIEENLVQYIRSFSPCQLCCFLLKEGIGDKLFLRLYGFQLGLKNLAKLKKRAIQFGSKIANKKQKATDRSMYL
ncbi:asparagine synthetase domain-containing protein CG17486 [Anastrepha obliqua]|uniref:asparagine synthetase domain-containing protein CG17486 n=1 Tax=Anastrepha obliqua TaxID=95512 RepID=UPI0024093E7E|nr:asparagine synthetase domain-containing protein CG17486 [Anastrepha obliqua]